MLTVHLLPATAPASCTHALSAAWPERPRSSRACQATRLATTSAAGLPTRLKSRRSRAPWRRPSASTPNWPKRWRWSHDIGHPPFGHAGEKALDRALQAYGLGFDHNLHALRIVTWFEERYAAFRGLNLTLGVREGIIKHSRDYLPAEHPELAEYFLDQLPPLEAQLIDLADEIAYLTADLDDGLDSGILTLDQVRENVALFRTCHDAVDTRIPRQPPRDWPPAKPSSAS